MARNSGSGRAMARPNRGRGMTRPYIAMLALVAGCNWYYDKLPSPDDLVKLIPWFDHMITSPAVHPYQRSDLPRRAVPGTVPVTGGEPDWGRGDPLRLQYAFDTLVANRLVNPLQPSDRLAQGDTVYQTFCALCHGSTGAGDGPVSRRIGAPSILTDRAKGYSDGYLYSLIRYGRGVMPLYGDKIPAIPDRWALVNYVRRLQGGVGAPAAPAPGAAP